MKRNEFKKLVVATGKRILNGSEYIRTNSKIKTDKRRKRALIDLWNSTIQRTIDTIQEPHPKAIIRAYYGIITESVLKDLEMNEAYSLVTEWAHELERGEVKS